MASALQSCTVKKKRIKSCVRAINLLTSCWHRAVLCLCACFRIINSKLFFWSTLLKNILNNFYEYFVSHSFPPPHWNSDHLLLPWSKQFQIRFITHTQTHTLTWTVELISEAKPPVTGASWLMSRRPVFTTDWQETKQINLCVKHEWCSRNTS